jgi:hypothetical protein
MTHKNIFAISAAMFFTGFGLTAITQIWMGHHPMDTLDASSIQANLSLMVCVAGGVIMILSLLLLPRRNVVTAFGFGIVMMALVKILDSDDGVIPEIGLAVFVGVGAMLLAIYNGTVLYHRRRYGQEANAVIPYRAPSRFDDWTSGGGTTV